MSGEIWYESKGAGQIHGYRWTPEGAPKAVVQIVHGIAEHIRRYDDFARFLTEQGYLVVAEDHMGHGASVNGDGIRGYFHGGWLTAVEDTYQLLTDTRAAYPDIPYVLFGHSMGSFMTRTLLCRHPDSGIAAAIICGTGWQPRAALPGLIKVVEIICGRSGETVPNEQLQSLVFGGYNKKVEHPRTPYDWLSRDAASVDAYMEDPMCGFTASAGLLRDMMKGIRFIEDPANLAAMRKDLPVYFIAGGDDPVGNYGKGVDRSAAAFRRAGMTDVSERIFPLCRHELLNEINKEEVYQAIAQWLQEKLGDNL